MMGRLLVTGAGHGGTNLAMQLIMASGQFTFTKMPEDRMFFLHKDLPSNYATKLATENKGFTVENISRALERYDDLKIIFSLRHPVDRCLSHIYRGRPVSQGGDSWEEVFDPAATFEKSPLDLEHMVRILRHLEINYSERVLRLPMEFIITNVEEAVAVVCDFLGIESNPSMFSPWKYCRHQFISKRYTNGLYKSQVDIYKRWNRIYDGYFKNDYEKVKMLCAALHEVAEYLGYNIEEI